MKLALLLMMFNRMRYMDSKRSRCISRWGVLSFYIGLWMSAEVFRTAHMHSGRRLCRRLRCAHGQRRHWYCIRRHGIHTVQTESRLSNLYADIDIINYADNVSAYR